MKNRNSDRIDALLASVTPELLNAGIGELADNRLHVERLLLDIVRPDPVQPRRILPAYIHHEFHENRMTPSQALRELVKLAQIAARQHGRPFGNVLELLPSTDDYRDDGDVKLSPEEQLLRDLVNLAITIRDDGQVNPLTVVDASHGITHLYRIETGERRYWATWLLRDFIPGYTGDGMIPCLIIPNQTSSVFRQAKENTARSGLTAIAMARQAALLLLTVHGYEIPNYAVPNDFYRQALELDLRGKREFTEAILSAMGGIDKSRFAQYKTLLHLSDEALEIADRHIVDERKLRYVVALDPGYHAEILQQIVSLNLTSAQVKDLCEPQNEESMGHGDDDVSANAQKIAKFALTKHSAHPKEIALAVLQKEGNPKVALLRLQELQTLLRESETFLLGD